MRIASWFEELAGNAEEYEVEHVYSGLQLKGFTKARLAPIDQPDGPQHVFVFHDGSALAVWEAHNNVIEVREVSNENLEHYQALADRQEVTNE